MKKRGSWLSWMVWAGLAGVLLVLPGCPATLLGSKPAAPTPNKSYTDDGMAYHPVKTLLRVKATVYREHTVTLKKEWRSLSNEEALNKTVRIAACNGSASLVQTADQNCSLFLKFEKSAWADNAFKIKASESGVLTSVNTQQTGKAGEMIVNTAKFAAGALAVAGMATGQFYLAVPAGVAGAAAFEVYTVPLPQLEQSTMPEEQQYFHRREKERNSQWSKVKELERGRKVAQLILKAQQEAYLSSSKDDYKNAKEKMEVCEKSLASATSKLETEMNDYLRRYNAFLLQTGLAGPVVKAASYERYFELDQLPLSTSVDCAGVDLQNLYKPVGDFLKKTGVVVAVCGAPESIVQKTSLFKLEPAVEFDDKSRVCYRPKDPIILHVYADIDSIVGSDGKAKAEAPDLMDDLASVSEEPGLVAFRKKPLLCVAAEGAAFSSHNVTLVYTNGALTEFSADSKSSAEAVSKAGADSMDGFLKAYMSQVNSAAAMQSNLLDLTKKSGDTALLALQNKKLMIEEQLAAAGAAEAKQLELEKEMLDKLIDIAKKRKEYDDAIEALSGTGVP
ncbi:MAG: hypothetical protein AB7D07_10975 [Desulfovibrionaceae bacterium]